MHDLDDHALLREYAANHSETAFEELVSRRINFVYSAALRQTRQPHLAEEITQAVFIILAQKAGKISDKTHLTGWLFKTTRFTALAQIRAETQRARQQKEFQMESEIQSTATDKLWDQMSPLLDEALAALRESDRQAVLLRFFENKSLAEVGQFLGIGEDTARKRISRALEKLHRHFHRRGVSSTTAILAGAISTNSIQAAPIGLAKTISTVAVAKGAAASTSTLTLVKGALKLMAWTKAKMAIATAAVVIVAAGTASVAVKDFNSKKEKSNVKAAFVTDSPIDTYLAKANLDSSEAISKAPPVLSVQMTHFPGQSGGSMYFDLPNTNLVEGLARNTSLVSILEAAYLFKSPRMILPKDLPDTNFDFMETLPNCSRKAFQDEIEMTLGFRAHPEVVATDVLLLKVKNADAPGLKISTATEPGIRQSWGDAIYWATNLPVSDLGSSLESIVFKRPVIDETGLTDRYDLNIKWEPHNENSLKKVLLDQLGLEIIPTNMPIKMLVVEKVK